MFISHLCEGRDFSFIEIIKDLHGTSLGKD